MERDWLARLVRRALPPEDMGAALPDGTAGERQVVADVVADLRAHLLADTLRDLAAPAAVLVAQLLVAVAAEGGAGAFVVSPLLACTLPLLLGAAFLNRYAYNRRIMLQVMREEWHGGGEEARRWRAPARNGAEKPR